jgi:hypothetical protein
MGVLDNAYFVARNGDCRNVERVGVARARVLFGELF